MYSLFKALHGKAPRYLEELITIYQPTRALRSENQSLLKPPSDVQTRTYGDIRFDTAAATLEQSVKFTKEHSICGFFQKGP
jgi:hypothetical protein